MDKNKRFKYIIASIINMIVFGIIIYCLISLIKSSINGDNCFIYFTNISNLFVGLIALFNVIFFLLSIIKNKDCVPKLLSLIKLVAISMTTLTFFTVLFVIGPVNGYPNSYSGRNFFTHLIVPLLSLFSYLFFEEKLQLKWRYSLLILVPFIIYSIFYLVNVIILGFWPDIYRINKQGLWYLYLFAFIIADFGFGQGLYFLKRLIDKKTSHEEESCS